jgi:hypothetical protein
MRDQYTSLEYFQIALFLIGMPLAALIGALLGLVGKWKQGRVVSAAILGLGGAALVSVVLFVTFLSIYLQIGTGRQSLMLEFFDGYFAQRIAILAVIATAAISLLAAIGLRARKSEQSRAASFSVRQLLLLQLFAFIALGCWTGMRFFALNCGSELERARRMWAQREWFVAGDPFGNPTYWARDYSMSKPDAAKENQYLREAVRIPTLTSLQLSQISFAEDLDIEELASAKKLETLLLSYTGSAHFEKGQVEAIGDISSLRYLYLQTNGKLSQEIEPIASLPMLDTLRLQDCFVTPKALDLLAKSKSLRRLHLQFTKNLFPREAPHWPLQLQELQIRQGVANMRVNLDNLGELKALQTLTIDWQRLTRSEVQAIAQCKSLETLLLDDAIDEADVELLLALNKLKIVTITEAAARRSAAFLESLEKVALMPSLENLNCDHQMVVTAEEWSGAKPMPGDRERGARQYAWVERINQKRAELGLRELRVTYSINAGPFLIVGGSGGATAAPPPTDAAP